MRKSNCFPLSKNFEIVVLVLPDHLFKITAFVEAYLRVRFKEPFKQEFSKLTHLNASNSCITAISKALLRSDLERKISVLNAERSYAVTQLPSTKSDLKTNASQLDKFCNVS